jgi:hypothetical protein
LERLEERWVPAGDMVLRWNTVMLDTAKIDHNIGAPGDEFGPTRTSRSFAIVQSAVYDAANSITHAFDPYKFSVAAAPGASVEAAIAQAAHDTLVYVYPHYVATFDADLAQDLAAIPAAAAQAGAAVGASVAAQMIASRSNDGSATNLPYTPTGQIGHWAPDPLNPTQTYLTPGWGNVTPFVMTSGNQFRPPPPPALNSAEYTAAYNELIQVGGDGTTTATQRTEDQTESAIYWGYDGQPGLCSPPRMLNQIAVQIGQQMGNTEMQNARYLCLVNLALGDAGISSWDAKLFYDFWRPIQAIRAGADDGNPNTQGDPLWAPLGAPGDNGSASNFTPPFPSYTSGHATFAGAMFRLIADFYGTDKIPFTFISDEFNGLTFDINGQVRPIRPRHFDTLSQAMEENGQSRIYLGIHFSFDKVAGINEGVSVGDYVFQHALRAKAHVRQFATGADIGGGPHVRVQETVTGRFIADFLAYDSAFRGGVRVANADVNGDGVPDIITSPGPGGGPHVKVFDGTDLHVIYSFMAYDVNFTGGVFVAAGDVDGDGKADIITAPDTGGGPVVRIFSGANGSMLRQFNAYDAAFRGGVHVAAGDINGDGKSDVITGAGIGGGPHVRAFSGVDNSSLLSFFAYDSAFRGGVYVAAGDMLGNGLAQIVTGAGAGGGPHIEVFNGSGVRVQSFVATLPPNNVVTNGIHVGAADVNGDGRADILCAAAAGSAPMVEARDAVSLTRYEQQYIYDPSFLGGIFVGGSS